jgi:hypothetical protein
MKKLALVIVVAFTSSFTMVSCGTEQDDSIGVDQQEMQDEGAVVPQKDFCIVVNGVLNGYSTNPGLKCAQKLNSTKCPIGATPIHVATICYISVDDAR